MIKPYKKLIFMIYTVLLISLISGCSVSGKSEYDIEEFGVLYEKTRELFEDESKYLTEEELYGNEGFKIFEKCSKKTGLPCNKEIILRGRKESTILGFNIVSIDEKYHIGVICDAKNDTSLFVENGENVIVKGIFSKKKGNHYGFLSDATFESPKTYDTTYKGNTIADIVKKLPSDKTFIDSVIYGEVTEISTLEEIEKRFGKYIDSKRTKFGDSVIRMDCEEGETGTIYLYYPKNVFGNINTGDKIAAQCDVSLLVGTELGNEFVPLSGIVYSIDNCYNFTNR